jgi:hypothetical protein
LHDRDLIEQLFGHPSADVLLGEIESTSREESALMAGRKRFIADLLSLRTAQAEDAGPDLGYTITGHPSASSIDQSA